MSLPSQRRGDFIALLIGIVVAAVVLYETLTMQTDAIESGKVTEVGGPFIDPWLGLPLLGLSAIVLGGSVLASRIRDRASAKGDRDSANGGERA